MNAKTATGRYSQVLWEEMKTWPFMVLVAFLAICLYFPTWSSFDGIIFHFQNFFGGELNNRLDFTRWVAIFVTDFPDLLYSNLGGSDFRTSTFLYSLGNTIHVFYPFFLLVYLKYRFPVHATWIRTTLHFYVMSFLIYKGFCYLFHITELNMAHTMTWLSIMSFRMKSLEPAKDKFLDNFIWTISILGILVYPLVLFTYGFFLVSQSISGPDSVKDGKKDLRIFFGSLILIEAICYIAYFYINNAPSLYEAFGYIKKNVTALYQVVALLLFFVLRPFFRWHYYLIFTVLVLARIFYSPTFNPWDQYMGRVIGLMFVILLQAFYIFILPRLDQETFFENMRERFVPYALLQCFMFICASVNMNQYHQNLIQLVRSEKRVVPFEEGRMALPYPYNHYASAWTIRTMSISLQILKDGKIEGLVNKKLVNSGTDLIDGLGIEKFKKRAAAKGVIWPEHLTLDAPDRPSIVGQN